MCALGLIIIEIKVVHKAKKLVHNFVSQRQIPTSYFNLDIEFSTFKIPFNVEVELQCLANCRELSMLRSNGNDEILC